MGLTVHYTLTAKPEWTRKDIRRVLTSLGERAKELEFLVVKPVEEFRGKAADFDNVEVTDEAADRWKWALIQASRSVENPYKPGCSITQPANHVICLSTTPAEGCEPMNLGWVSYPRFVWPKHDGAPGWSLVFKKRHDYRESEKLIRAFLRKWRLVKLPEPKSCDLWRNPVLKHLDVPAALKSDYGKAQLVKGPYRSHRKGYGPGFGLVTIRDYQGQYGGPWEVRFKYQGTLEEAEAAFTNPEFLRELKDLADGPEEYVAPAAHGTWDSFCKTQYANSPACGGLRNFITAHLRVVALLECCQAAGFGVRVVDESDYWEHRDLAKLGVEIREWDAMIAAGAGAMRDAVAAAGGDPAQLHSPILGRPDFEANEFRGSQDPHVARFQELMRQVTAQVPAGEETEESCE